MQIDDASYRLIRLALHLNTLQKGSVSSIWLDKPLQKEISAKLPRRFDLEEETFEINSKITLLNDQRRKTYLNSILQTVVYQIRLQKEEIEFNYTEFLKHCFGHNIERVHEVELKRLEVKISDLESKLRMSRFQVIKEDMVPKRSVVKQFQGKLEQIKNKLPGQLKLPGGEQMLSGGTSRKPWSAFNNHTSPYISEIQINLDVPQTHTDLLHLAVHEGYGGHHTELCLKDKLLLKGQGEHGFCVTFSPQTFISEAIAEAAIIIFDLLPHGRKQILIHEYNRLKAALLNLSSFWYFQDGIEKADIKRKLMKFNISEDTRLSILRFATDDFWGKYGVVYYTGYSFLMNLYSKLENKEPMLSEIYTQPVTPEMLTMRYS